MGNKATDYDKVLDELSNQLHRIWHIEQAYENRDWDYVGEILSEGKR